MKEILVGIGEFKISSSPDLLRTNLGSCVGVFLYDSISKTGGLLHILLPRCGNKNENTDKYADTGIDNMISAFEKKGINKSRLTAKIFGGAHVVTLLKKNIGKENIAVVKERLKMHRIKIVSEKTGGNKGCLITAYLEDGKVKFRAFGEHEKTF